MAINKVSCRYYHRPLNKIDGRWVDRQANNASDGFASFGGGGIGSDA